MSLDAANLNINIDSSEARTAAGDLDRLAKKAGPAATSVKSVGKAGQLASAGLSNFKRQIVTTIGALVSIAAAVAVARKSIGDGLGFDAALAEASTLIEGTAVELDEMSEAARRMAIAFGGDATSQIRGFYQAISAGASTVTEATGLLEEANQLALGGVTDLVTAVDVLTTAVNSYAQAGLTAADASDTLFIGILKGKTTAAELGASLGKVTSIAAQVGFSFQELVASVAALTAGGIQTAEAVTGMRSIIAGLLSPTTQATELAKKLGIEFSTAALKTKGLAGFMEDLVERTGGSQEQIATLFGNVRALGAVLAFTGAAGDKFNETMEAMAGRTGAAQRAADKMAASISQRLKVQMSLISDQFLTVGLNLLNVMVPALELFTGNIELLAKALVVLVATQLPRLVALLAAAVAGMLASASATGVFTGAVALLTRGLVLLGGPLGLLFGLAGALGAAFFGASDGAVTLEENLQRLDGSISDVRRSMSNLDRVEDGLEKSTGQLEEANEDLADAIRAGESAAIAVAVTEVEQIRKRIAANESLRQKYVDVLKTQQLTLKTEAQLAETAFRNEFGGPQSRTVTVDRVPDFEDETDIFFNTVDQRISDVERDAVVALRRAEADARLIAGTATDADLRFRRLDATIAATLEAAAALADAIANIETDVVTPLPSPTTGTGTDTVSLTVTDIQGLIEAEAQLREEIGATIVTLGEEEIVRIRLLSQIELDRIARELDAAAIEATTDKQREEIRQAQELLPVLRAITAARIEDEEALRQEIEAQEQQQDVVDDLQGSFENFFQTIVSGSVSAKDALVALGLELLNIIQRLVEARIASEAGGSSGGGGGGILGSLLSFVGPALGLIGGGGGGATGFAGNTGTGFAPGSFGGVADGAAFLNGTILPFARGGVVTRPTIFPMASGFGLMGEAGPEAVLPLRRGPGGKLGVESTGGGTQNTFFIDATGADQAAISRLESALVATVGPGVIERRAVAAVLRAQGRGEMQGAA